MRFPSARILVFAKAPVAGSAKTRLIPALGADGAAGLHADLLRQLIERIAVARTERRQEWPATPVAPVAPVELWCAPDSRHALFQDLAQKFDLGLRAQCGGDLGERLLRASADALTRARAVVLIGSDCPDMTADILASALALLAQPEVDAVLGPAADGGYVLLALRQAEPMLFRDMPWGGERVADITRQRLSALRWRWRELPVLRDLDRAEDLAWYCRESSSE